MKYLKLTISLAIVFSIVLGRELDQVRNSDGNIQWSGSFELTKKTMGKSKLVYVNPNSVNYHFIYNGERNLEETQTFFADDTPVGLDNVNTISIPAQIPQKYMHHRVINRINESLELWSFSISPIRYISETNQYRQISTFQLDISTGINQVNSGDTEQIFQNLYLNKVDYQSNTVLNHSLGMAMGKVKIKISKDGIYRIYYDDLYDLEILANEIDVFDIKLQNKGVDIPIFIEHHFDNLFSEGDYIEFIGKQKYSDSATHYLDPYTKINVYWLDWGSGKMGLRLLEESGLPNESNPLRPVAFRDVVHFEKDIRFEKLGNLDANLPTNTRDHLFWTAIDAGYNVYLPLEIGNAYRASTNNVLFKIGLQGLTYSEDGSQDHNVFAYLNDQSVGSGSWLQQQPYVLETPSTLNLSHSIISPSENILSISAPVSQDPGRYDKSMLNWIEIEYDREFIVQDDALVFRKSNINPDGLSEFEIGNMSSQDISIIKEGVSKMREFVIREDDNTGRFSAYFQDDLTVNTPDYWISSGEAIETPAYIQLDTVANLREKNGDLILIIPRQYADNINNLLEHKTAMGWNPVIAIVDDIYDEFNYGISSPEAIKSFLKFAYSSWSMHPKYAILIGDATGSIESASSDTFNVDLPPYLMQTFKYGSVESDIWFGQLENDDLIPEMIISRIPVASNDELDVVTQKIILYETSDVAGKWQNDVLTIAGFENTFKYQSESLIRNQIPDEYEVSRLFIDRDSEGQIHWGDTDSLTKQWNAGKLLINFLGHGGGAVWADRSLFTREDVASLTNEEALSFVASMTCFTGSFSRNAGLGEAVITENSAGAIGWIGSAGVGWIINDYLMVQPMLKSLLNDDVTIGEAVFNAKVQYYLTNNAYPEIAITMLNQYNLLGDPTIRIKRPTQTTILDLASPNITVGSDLLLQKMINKSGQLTYRILDEQEQLLNSSQLFYDGNTAESLNLPIESLNLQQGQYTISLDLLTEPENKIYHQSINFVIDSTIFNHDVFTDPVDMNTSILFSTTIHSNHTIDSVKCNILTINETLDLSLHDNNNWKAKNNWIYSNDVPFIEYQFVAYSGNQNFRSERYTITRNLRENIQLVSVDWGTSDLQTGYVLATHSSSINTQNIQVRILNTSDTLEVSDEIKGGKDTLFIPSFSPLKGNISIELISMLDEESLSDNSINTQITQNYWAVVQGIGITKDGLSKYLLPAFSGNLNVSNSVNGWIKIDTLEQIQSGQQKINYLSNGGYRVEQSGNINLVLKGETNKILLSKSIPLLWQQISGTSIDSQVVTADIKSIALGYSTDNLSPDISFSISGQRFFDGDYVDEFATLGWLVEDASGIPIDSNYIHISLDGQSIALNELSINSTNVAINAIQYSAELSTGKHHLNYSITDAFNNKSLEKEIELIVAEEKSIIDYGNFPNPFTSETNFVYELTRHMDDIVIEIFAVSGYKVKEINDMNARVDLSLGAIAYHEVPWDGKDNFGDFVANGVYFYRIIGTYQDETIESPVGKVVKNR